MSRLTIILALSLSVVGCHAKPRYTGPIFQLPSIEETDQAGRSDQLASPIIQAEFTSGASQAAPVSVNFIDVRPSWQTQYYNGSNAPQDWAIARTIIPLENFEPKIEAHLERAIQIELAKFAKPPKSVDVTIRSFECVCDMSTEMRRELDVTIERELAQFNQDEKARDEDRSERRRKDAQRDREMQRAAQFTDQKEEKNSFVGEIVGGIIQGIFQAIIDGRTDGRSVDKIERGDTLPKFRASENFDVVLAPDEEFRREYPDGWSCRLVAQVTSTWADGTQTETTITTESIVAAEHGASDIGKVVMQAVQTFAVEVAQSHDRDSHGSKAPVFGQPAKD